ncbi:MAG: fumarate hydratase C-terminal domain-containing protein, partial [Methanomassiliicoccales archaeon]|nr:fumarate hydratase C-terminal domain-containing protein [Methanomassiliicoccales archaeon]
MRTPLSEKEVRSLKAGQVVHLDGLVYTGRDEVHVRALEKHDKGEGLPVDLRGAALYHCGPIVKDDDGGWTLVAAGPTTSARMNALEPRFIEAFGIRAIIGKGGMSQPTIDAMSVDSREVICNSVQYLSAETAIINPDEKTIEYVKENTEKDFTVVKSDEDAEFAQVKNYDVSKLEPQIVVPPDVFYVKDV